jgi:hypothetical protein
MPSVHRRRAPNRLGTTQCARVRPNRASQFSLGTLSKIGRQGRRSGAQRQYQTRHGEAGTAERRATMELAPAAQTAGSRWPSAAYRGWAVPGDGWCPPELPDQHTCTSFALSALRWAVLVNGAPRRTARILDRDVSRFPLCGKPRSPEILGRSRSGSRSKGST